jgi:hypothetical protein
LVEEAKIGVTWKNADGETPLSLAAANGHDEIVEYLKNAEGVCAEARRRRDSQPRLSKFSECGKLCVIN